MNFLCGLAITFIIVLSASLAGCASNPFDGLFHSYIGQDRIDAASSVMDQEACKTFKRLSWSKRYPDDAIKEIKEYNAVHSKVCGD